MTGRIHPLLLHLAGCVLFLSLPILFSPESLSLRSYLGNPPTQRDLIAYLLVLGAFYVNYFLLIPGLYFPRKYPAFILLNACCLAILIALPLALIPRSLPKSPPGFNGIPTHQGPPYPTPPNQPAPTSGTPPNQAAPTPATPQNQPAPPTTDPTVHLVPSPSPFFPANHPRGGDFSGSRPFRLMDLSQHLFLFLVILFLALLLKIRDRWKRAEEEKLHAELAYLKTQINPHFLFNILNSIYALALERSDRAAGAVVKLSSMMRYVLLETSRERVPLEQEINYLTDYIQLQQTRFDGILDLGFTVTGQPEGKTIAPLLLIPFVENAFKHGVNPEQPSAILVRIDIREPEFHLQVTNKKVVTQPQLPGPSGLGIKNTRQRLEILYPGRHTLSIEDGPTDFYVSLTLHLK